MRILSSSLGLTAIAAAIAVAVGVRSAPHDQKPDANSTNNSTFLTSNPPSPSRKTASKTSSTRIAHSEARLEQLAEELYLSDEQRIQIHPALIRASHDYDPGEPYQTLANPEPDFLGPPLTRPDFEDALFAILDGEQQLDYAANASEKDLWWSSVISRLEADLENQTNPVHAPQPQAPEPEPEEPATVEPSANRGRRITLPNSDS